MYHNKSFDEVLTEFGVNKNIGLDEKAVEKSRLTYGSNQITQAKDKGVFSRILSALTEPMMIILLIAFAITLGVNIGKYIASKDGDFMECIGIFIAIALSVGLNVIMEGKSQKAFSALNKMSDNKKVKVLRGGSERLIFSNELVVGDIVYLNAGDKVSCDIRLISATNLVADESMLTGESAKVEKNSQLILSKNAPLAERANMVFSGTYITDGFGCGVVCAVGDHGEMGKLAQGLSSKLSLSAPLEEKLSRLGKVISIFGAISALSVFALSLARLIILHEVSILSVQDIFIEAIILIVACVPEGLPSTVAISLTLNVVKLAKSNALIKKLIATETIGSVSVICSDKTGTLTENQMSVNCFIGGDLKKITLSNKYLKMNIAINSTADIIGGKVVGSQTEGALIKALESSGGNYKNLRKEGKILSQIPFSSQIKFMQTQAEIYGENVTLIKGAPEIILEKVTVQTHLIPAIKHAINEYQTKTMRVIAFAHKKGQSTFFDGFAVLQDKIRDDVIDSVNECINAGIKVKVLTGDNISTAMAIANAIGIGDGYGKAVTGSEIDGWSDSELSRRISDISVVARSTPNVKLRVVKALQANGEVVAVTGDGINDAPAIRHADIGIGMGDGSEITKEASDVILLDNRFSTIVTAISFGRNIYKNFQRFITFQLTVNISAMCIIIAYLLMGMESPFSSTCILWLNVLMDGPLAISLALEKPSKNILNAPPAKRSESIISAKIALRIAFTGIAIAFVVVLQEMYNFLGASVVQKHTVTFATFVFFQVFNAINCREIRLKSALSDIFANKLLLIVGVLTYILQIIITQFAPSIFQTVPLELSLWLKITALCSLVIVVSELVKCILRAFKSKWQIKGKVYDSRNGCRL